MPKKKRQHYRVQTCDNQLAHACVEDFVRDALRIVRQDAEMFAEQNGRSLENATYYETWHTVSENPDSYSIYALCTLDFPGCRYTFSVSQLIQQSESAVTSYRIIQTRKSFSTLSIALSDKSLEQEREVTPVENTNGQQPSEPDIDAYEVYKSAGLQQWARSDREKNQHIIRKGGKQPSTPLSRAQKRNAFFQQVAEGMSDFEGCVNRPRY